MGVLVPRFMDVPRERSSTAFSAGVAIELLGIFLAGVVFERHSESHER